ncbi:MAG: ankyrin repeat domain-containing protein [Bdellovibrionota bacterium]
MFIVLISLAILMPAGGRAALADHAKIEAIGGGNNVTVKRSGKSLQLKQGDLLEAGDELATDDHTAADIRFDDQTLVRVGVNSNYRIVEDAGTTKFLHRLFAGVVRVLVPVKKEAKTEEIKFKMKTPQGTIGVRGTEFTVAIAKGETALHGLSGEVQFGSVDADYADTSKFVYVGRGMMSTVAAGKAATKPVKYDMDKYQKEINSSSGVFGAVAKRSNLNMLRRGENAPVVASNSGGIGQPKAETTVHNVVAPAKVMPKEKAKRSLEAQLIDAIIAKSLPQVKALMKAGADVNYKAEDNVTPLHYAVISESLEIVQTLISAGAKVNATTKSGNTPLMQVAIDSAPKVIAELLIQNDADPKLKNKADMTALEIALAKPEKDRDDELVEFLQKVTE